MMPIQASAQPEPGSFRDPDSRVFYAGDEIYRALSGEGMADFDALERSGLLDDPRIVRTERADLAHVPENLLSTDIAGLLTHEPIPFVSYPYEWTFSMLKGAALLQLDLLLAALDHDLVLKDSTPYNVQYKGARPIFIDIGAFERLRTGELWVGYRQFCMLYLFPLLLQALKGVRFQPWLRGSVDGITATEARAQLSFRDRFRRGLTTNVFLQARLERREVGSAEIKREVKRAGVERQLISANARRMRKLVERLRWNPPPGTWVGYEQDNAYDSEDIRRKETFVLDVAASNRWQLVWDLGANTGRYSRLAAPRSRCVVAIDADDGAVELHYRRLREVGDETILPLTMNLADPSPALGWRGLERKTLLERGRPDLVLALALVHHLSIGANVPVRELVGWLADIGAATVIEFPTRDDPMVQRLLARKREGLHPDYERSFFERCLRESFEVRRSEELGSGTRVLYYATPRAS